MAAQGATGTSWVAAARGPPLCEERQGQRLLSREDDIAIETIGGVALGASSNPRRRKLAGDPLAPDRSSGPLLAQGFPFDQKRDHKATLGKTESSNRERGSPAPEKGQRPSALGSIECTQQLSTQPARNGNQGSQAQGTHLGQIGLPGTAPLVEERRERLPWHLIKAFVSDTVSLEVA